MPFAKANDMVEALKPPSWQSAMDSCFCNKITISPDPPSSPTSHHGSFRGESRHQRVTIHPSNARRSTIASLALFAISQFDLGRSAALESPQQHRYDPAPVLAEALPLQGDAALSSRGLP